MKNHQPLVREVAWVLLNYWSGGFRLWFPRTCCEC